MFFFILQTLFLAFVAFLLGWLLGRFIKGFFCKSTDTTEPRTALKTELDSSKEDHSSSDSSRVTKSAVVSTAAATATAAIIAKMASDVKDESSVDKVSDTRNRIVEESPLVGKTDDVSSNIKATIEKSSIVATVKQSDEETKETLKNSVIIDNVEHKINDSVVDLENKAVKEKNAPVRHLVDKANDSVIGDTVEIKNDIENKAINVQANDVPQVINDANKDRSKAVDTQNDDSATLFDSAKALAVAAGVGIAAKTGADAIKGADTVNDIATETGEATKNSVEKTGDIDDVSFDKRIHSVVINDDLVVTSEVILEEKLTKTPNDLDLDLSKGEALKEERHVVVNIEDKMDGVSVDLKDVVEKNDIIENIKDKVDGVSVDFKDVVGKNDIEENDHVNIKKGSSKAVDTQNDDSSTLFDSAKALALAAGLGIAAKTGIDAIKGEGTAKKIAEETGEATKNSAEKIADIDDSSLEKRIHSVVINDDLVVTSEVILEEKLTKTSNDLELSKGEALKEQHHLIGNIDDKVEGASNGVKTVVEKIDIIDQAKEKLSGVADGTVAIKNDVIDNIKDKVDSVAVDLKDVAEKNNLIDQAKEKLSGVADGAVTIKNDVIDNIKDKVDSVSVDLKDVVEKSNLIDQAKEKLSGVAGGAVTIKNDVIDNIKDKVDGVAVDLKDAVEKNNLIDQAKEKISGVADGAVAIKNNVTKTQGEAHHSTLFDIAVVAAGAAGAGIVAKVGVDAVKSGDNTAKKMIEETGEVIKNKSEKTSDAVLSLKETKIVDTHDDRATVLDIAKASAVAAVAGIVAKKHVDNVTNISDDNVKKNEDIIDKNEKALEKEFTKKIEGFSDSIPDELNFTHSMDAKITDAVDDKVNHISKEDDGEIATLYRHYNLHRFRSSRRNIHGVNLPSGHIRRFSSSPSNNRRFIAVRKIDDKIL